MKEGMYLFLVCPFCIKVGQPSIAKGHSKSRNGKWEMRNGKRGNGEMEQQPQAVSQCNRIVSLRYKAVVHSLHHSMHANYNSHTVIIFSTEPVCVSTKE